MAASFEDDGGVAKRRGLSINSRSSHGPQGSEERTQTRSESATQRILAVRRLKDKPAESPADRGSSTDVKKARGHWDSEIEFFLATMGYAIGLVPLSDTVKGPGNLWRFPYLCYKFGGGAFLIPYGIALFAVGLPVFYLELTLGQYAGKGPVQLFTKMSPMFAGVGWSMIWIAFTVSVYYNVIITWIIIYWGLSWDFRGLWWQHCDNWWNTHTPFECVNILDYSTLQSIYDTRNTSVMSWMTDTVFNSFVHEWQVYHELRMNLNITVPSPPAEEFFRNYLYDMLAMGDAPGTGYPMWRLVLSLAVAWLVPVPDSGMSCKVSKVMVWDCPLVVFLCLMFGVKSLGKVVYVTSLMPFVVLAIMLVRGFTLTNAMEGAKYYITPDIGSLANAQVWQEAAMQICYSLGPGFGTLPTMSSYNHLHNNVWRDAVLVALINCCTSVIGGFAVFTVIGYLKYTLGGNVAMDNVVKQGHTLTFITYPEAIGTMWAPNLWSILFFTMLLLLGLDSQFAMVETVTTAVLDNFIHLRPYKPAVVGATCFAMFLAAIPQCCQGGLYHFSIWLNYSAYWGLLIILFVEIFAVAYVFGWNRLVRGINVMLGHKKFIKQIAVTVGPTGWYWRVTWMVILLWNFVKYRTMSESGHLLSGWWEAGGLGMALLPAVLICAFAIYAVIARKKGEPWRVIWRPNRHFGRKPKRKGEERSLSPQRDSYDWASASDSGTQPSESGTVMSPPQAEDRKSKTASNAGSRETSHDSKVAARKSGKKSKN